MIAPIYILEAMKILAIESSCDETAAAVIADGRKVLSSVIASQIDIHAQFGGVVPEVAARSHIEVVIPVIEQALREASTDWNDIDAIAVTRGPGLIGSLLIGTLTAQTLAELEHKPLIGVNHIVAHAFAANLTDTPPSFPMLALTVSGGHTALTLYQDDLSAEIVGETQDDAAGEAFDKVAKLLGLPYPGGPAVSKVAADGNDTAYPFPHAKLRNPLDFSFSGLKTAVLRQVQQITGVNPGDLTIPKSYELEPQVLADIAASFEKTVVDTLVKNTKLAIEQYQPASVVVGGGVAANKRLREELSQAVPGAIFVPPVLCTDNAAMIGALAYQMQKRGRVTSPFELKADSSLEVL